MKTEDRHYFERSEYDPERCAHCGHKRASTVHRLLTWG